MLGAASAAPSWADPAPSYAELVARLDQTPASAEAAALVDAAEARVRQARVRPNPSLELSAENVAGSGPYSGFGGGDFSLSFSQDLELWGRRPAVSIRARSRLKDAAPASARAAFTLAGRRPHNSRS